MELIDLIKDSINAGTKETIELSNEFARIGVDACLVITPCFFKAAMNG